MKIEKLYKIRNKSVQLQNQITYLKIKKEVDTFRESPERYPWLVAVLAVYGQKPSDGLLVSSHDLPAQGGYHWSGIWLTKDKKFYEFDVVTDCINHSLIAVDEWAEINLEISAHCKGTGKSFGYLALQLLAEYKSD